MGKVPTGSAWLAELAAGAPRGVAAGKTHTLYDENLIKEYGKFPKLKKVGGA